MGNQKNGVNGFISKLEDFSDKVVSKVYNESLINQVESLDFMKRLVNSSFIKGLQNFGEGWFKQVFVFFGYLSIIGGVLMLFNTLYILTQVLGSGLLILSSFILFGIYFLSILGGVGMIKFKKWYFFIVLLQTILYMLSSIVTYYIYSNSYYGKIFGGTIVDLAIELCFSLLIFIIFYALLLRNKKLFSGKQELKREVGEDNSKSEL